MSTINTQPTTPTPAWRTFTDSALKVAAATIGSGEGASKPDNFISSHINQDPARSRWIGAGVMLGAAVVSSVADGWTGFGVGALFGGAIGLTAASKLNLPKQQGLIAAAAAAGVCALGGAWGSFGLTTLLAKAAIGTAVGAAMPEMYAKGQFEQYYR